MGPSKINDIEMEDGTIAKDSGVLVERCDCARLLLMGSPVLRSYKSASHRLES